MNYNIFYLLIFLFCFKLDASQYQLKGQQYLSILQIDQKSNDQFIRKLQNFIPLACNSCENRNDGWGEISGSEGLFTNTRNHIESKSLKVFTGASLPLCNCLLIGALGNYENNILDYNLGGHAHLAQGRLGMYGIFFEPRFYISINAFGGFGHCHLKRKIDFDFLSLEAKSRFCIGSGTFYAEIGSNLHWCEDKIQPFFGWEYSYFCRAKTREHGGGIFNLKPHSQGYGIPSTRLGVHLASVICPNVEACADFVWRHNFDYNKRGCTMQFLNFGHSFRVHSNVVSPNVLEYLITLSTKLSKCLSTYLQFSGECSHNYSDYEISLGIFGAF